jgi:hypothetical protein
MAPRTALALQLVAVGAVAVVTASAIVTRCSTSGERDTTASSQRLDDPGPTTRIEQAELVAEDAAAVTPPAPAPVSRLPDPPAPPATEEPADAGPPRAVAAAQEPEPDAGEPAPEPPDAGAVAEPALDAGGPPRPDAGAAALARMLDSYLGRPDPALGAGQFSTAAPPWSASAYVSNPEAGAGEFTTDWKTPPATGFIWIWPPLVLPPPPPEAPR